MAARRFQTPSRRQRSRPVKAVPALLCAAATAAAVAAYSCSASLSFASRPSGLCVPQAARRTAASPCGSRLPRASRGGETPEDPDLPLEKLEVGQKYTGTVRKVLQDFGAFVDIGTTKDGLVHKSAISEEFVDDVDDYLHEGQEVEVWIRELRDDGKFDLTMVEGLIGPKAPKPSMKVGEKYTGTVSSVRDFGAFVDIGGDKIGGLVHKSCIAEEYVDNTHDYVQEGQEVEVWVSKILDNGKLALTMVESKVGNGPQRHWLDDRSPDEWLQGAVTSVHAFGAFVKVSHFGETAEGLVPMGELADAYVENAEDEVQKGQKVWVRVLKHDAKEKKLSLSMKQPLRPGQRPADLLKFEGVSPDQWLTGKVTATTPYGAFVTVAGEDGSEASGLLHVKNIRDDLVESFEDELQSGQEVKVRIVDLDAGAGRMGLSMKPADSHEE